MAGVFLIVLIVIAVLVLAFCAAQLMPRIKGGGGQPAKKVAELHSGDFTPSYDAALTHSLVQRVPFIRELMKSAPAIIHADKLLTRMPVENIARVVIPIHEVRPVEEFFAVLNFLVEELSHKHEMKIVSVVGAPVFSLELILRYFKNVVFVADTNKPHDLIINFTGKPVQGKKQLVQAYVPAQAAYLPACGDKECVPWMIIGDPPENKITDMNDLRAGIFAWKVGQRVKGAHAIEPHELELKFDSCGDCATILTILRNYRRKFGSAGVSKKDRATIKLLYPEFFLRHEVNRVYKEIGFPGIRKPGKHMAGWIINNMEYSQFEPKKLGVLDAYRFRQICVKMHILAPDVRYLDRFLILSKMFKNPRLEFDILNLILYDFDLCELSSEVYSLATHAVHKVIEKKDMISIDGETFGKSECAPSDLSVSDFVAYSLLFGPDTSVVIDSGICAMIAAAAKKHGYDKIVGVSLNPLARIICTVVTDYKYFIDEHIKFEPQNLYVVYLAGLPDIVKYIIMIQIKISRVTALVISRVDPSITSAGGYNIANPHNILMDHIIVNGATQYLTSCKTKMLELVVRMNNINGESLVGES